MRLLLIALLLQACLIPDSLIRDVIDRDNDGEKALGYDGEFGVGTDCDDRNARVGATLPEICDDGLDNNCDGLVDGPTAPNTGTRWYEDRDGDGYGSVVLPTWSCTKPPGAFYATAGDCDDRNANANPGAQEACNGFDDDCDALVDEDGDLVRWYADSDGDGHGNPHVWVQACQRPAGYLQSGTDCDDQDPNVHPNAPEVWYDGLDADCADGDDFDQDGDGARHPSAYADAPPPDALIDCDDLDNRVFPGAPEVWYDGTDQDCDPRTEWDQDNDGYTRTNAPTGSADDCDDERVLIGPPTPRYLDFDTDGYGDPSNFLLACSPLPGRTSTGADCNDREITIHPAALERCNGIDDNCNGAVDESGGTSYWPDVDRDGQGDADADLVTSCARPPDHAPNGDDCDDANPTVYLGAPERCTNLDNNCNGLIDDVTDAQYNHWFDADRDGYGNPALPPVPTCTPTQGLVTNDDDCDDTRGNVFPGNPEVCDNLDNNCNRSVDEGVLTTFWFDFDLDGFGNALGTGPYAPLQACSAPTGWVSNDDDCDDTTNLRSPVRVETCDHLDNDCDLTIDEGVRTSYWPDDDRDTFGDDDASPLLLCAGEQPAHWVTNDDDCDDDEPTTYPSWEEDDCDGIDNDCDGQADETLTERYYVDADGDGQADEHALATSGVDLCNPRAGYSTARTDCDDTNPRIYFGFSEEVSNAAMCDGLDNDCRDDTPGDPPATCGVGTLSVAVLGSRYLLHSADDTLNLVEAEDWCEDRGYHLWWVDDATSLEALTVFANLDAAHNGDFLRDAYYGEVFHIGVRTHCPGVPATICNGANPQICLPRDYWHWRDGAMPRPSCSPAWAEAPSHIPYFSATPRTMHARISDMEPTNPTINVPWVAWESATTTSTAFTLCEREDP